MATRAELRAAAETSFLVFLQLMNPLYKYASVHKECADYLQVAYEEGMDALALLPRGHLKSHILANFAVWLITKDPTESIVYTCYSSDLARKQVFAMKLVIISKPYRELWPENVQGKEGCKTLWRSEEFMIDNPLLKTLNSREASVSIGTLNSPKTGHHPTTLMFDDLVVIDRKSSYPSAHHEEGRRAVREVVASLNNTLPASGRRFAVGTRYHPKDQYQIWMDSTTPEFATNTNGDLVQVGVKKVWKTMTRQVETDGTFLWPLQRDAQGREHGMNQQLLAKRRSEELLNTGHLEQFYAQYYNQCNASDMNSINRDMFRYYERTDLSKDGKAWTLCRNGYEPTRLRLSAALDLAFSTSSTADYTAVMVVGLDRENNVYVLDIDQYKTEDFNVHTTKLKALHAKWGFNEIVVEMNGPQKANGPRLQNALKKSGVSLAVVPFIPRESKQERMTAVLDPKYRLNQVFHPKGALYLDELEDQLELFKPKHDDLKDALAVAIEFSKLPTGLVRTGPKKKKVYSKYGY